MTVNDSFVFVNLVVITNGNWLYCVVRIQKKCKSTLPVKTDGINVISTFFLFEIPALRNSTC